MLPQMLFSRKNVRTRYNDVSDKTKGEQMTDEHAPIDWDTEIEARDFSTDLPPLRVGQTILVCMSSEDAADDQVDLMSRSASCQSKREYVQILKEFDELCCVGRMVSRTDDFVRIKVVGSGDIVEFEIDEILAAMTPPDAPTRNDRGQEQEESDGE